MKSKKSKVFVIALAVCLIATLSMGTLAWFSAKDEVKNEFMIADSTDVNPEDIFSIDVWEIDPESNEREETGHKYEKILPGDSLKKDVFVQNTGYYDQYVRVIVTISDAQAWVATGATPEAVFKGLDLTKWDHIYNNLSEDATAENLIYVLYYKDIVKAEDVINVFNSIEIPTSLTREQAAKFGGGFTIDVKAQAVQTENVVDLNNIPAGKTAAWVAFDTVGMSIAD